jgi:TPR repeat protein
MKNEIVLMGETGGLKSAFLNVLLGIWIYPTNSKTGEIPIVKISQGNLPGLWMRQRGETYSMIPVDGWNDIPNDWSTFEYVEMVIQDHRILSKGLTIWVLPEFSADGSSTDDIILSFLINRHKYFGSLYLFTNQNNINRDNDFIKSIHQLENEIVNIVDKCDTNFKTQSLSDLSCRSQIRTINIDRQVIEKLAAAISSNREDYTEWEILRRYKTIRIEPSQEFYDSEITRDILEKSLDLMNEAHPDYDSMDEITLEKLYRKGDAKSALVLSNRYAAKKEIQSTLKWIEASAEGGCDEAQYNLGNLYDEGIGVNQDLQKAVLWYKKASDQNNPNACVCLSNCYSLGRGVERDYTEQIRLLKKAIGLGCPRAIHNLAVCYYNGQGVMVDMKKAISLTIDAAEKGDEQAQFNLGYYHAVGKHFEKNIEEAVRWYEKAAANGSGSAGLNLGLLYHQGEEVSQSYEKAFEWFKKGAENGDATAQSNVGVYYQEGYFVEKNVVEAFKWYAKAAENGGIDGKYNLGLAYYHGHGCKVDRKFAIELMRQAANLGSELAINFLASI